MEMGKDEIVGQDYVVLMNPEPASRLKTQYRSLRRQVYFFQSVSLLLCFTCCMFTVMYYHSYPSTCKGNGVDETPTPGKQFQQREETSTYITRLIVKRGATVSAESGNVSWQLLQESQESNHTKYLTLNNDHETLTVHREGTYKVSLQITYKGNNQWYKRNTTSNSFQLQHEVQLYTDSYPKRPLPLLTHTETVNFTSPEWIKSLFSEGIFSLGRGDRLKVITTCLPLIDKSYHETVFVVYPHFYT